MSSALNDILVELRLLRALIEGLIPPATVGDALVVYPCGPRHPTPTAARLCAEAQVLARRSDAARRMP